MKDVLDMVAQIAASGRKRNEDTFSTRIHETAREIDFK